MHTLFFYFDAYSNEDLPLAEEIDIIFGRSPHAVVMIDDFEVTDDPGFAYDDYGPGKALNMWRTPDRHTKADSMRAQ
jgi:hypothetical protein